MRVLNRIFGTGSNSHGRVVAHILDPITGYSNRDLRIGKDIDPDTVRRLGEDGKVFVIVTYDGGVPAANVCKRAQWLRAQAKQEAIGQAADASVWRSRDELEIS